MLPPGRFASVHSYLEFDCVHVTLLPTAHSPCDRASPVTVNERCTPTSGVVPTAHEVAPWVAGIERVWMTPCSSRNIASEPASRRRRGTATCSGRAVRSSSQPQEWAGMNLPTNSATTRIHRRRIPFGDRANVQFANFLRQQAWTTTPNSVGITEIPQGAYLSYFADMS